MLSNQSGVARGYFGEPRDVILIDGKILTVDAKDSIVEAVAIAKGKIVAVGSTAEIQRLAGSATQTIDLNGAQSVASLITPVPGGVGPTTIAVLIEQSEIRHRVRPRSRPRLRDARPTAPRRAACAWTTSTST